MKIICLARSLDTGGAERQLTGLAAMLKDDGHDVTMVTYHDGAFFDDLLYEHGVRHIQVRKRATTLALDIRLASLIKKEGAELVIAFSSSAGRKACGAKLFYRDFRLIVSERNANPKLNIFDGYRMLVWGFAEKIISNSYAQEAILKKHFPRRGARVSTIVNFVDTATFSPMEQDVHERFVLATTARICKRKNIHGYIRAVQIAAARGYRPLVLWYGVKRDSKYLRKCMAMIQEAGLEGDFKILPAEKNVKEIYRRCDAFCLPSFYEGTSNSLTEALACARPAICSNVSDNPLYVRESETGILFDPRDPESIADAICRMMDLSPEERMAYGLKGSELVRKALDPEVFHAKYRALIEDNGN